MTKTAKVNDIVRDWVVLDAKDKVFDRLITEIAVLLRGKHRPFYTPNVDCGDFVVVINANKVKFSGMKLEDKEYFTHSGYFGRHQEQDSPRNARKSP